MSAADELRAFVLELVRFPEGAPPSGMEAMIFHVAALVERVRELPSSEHKHAIESKLFGLAAMIAVLVFSAEQVKLPVFRLEERK